MFESLRIILEESLRANCLLIGEFGDKKSPLFKALLLARKLCNPPVRLGEFRTPSMTKWSKSSYWVTLAIDLRDFFVLPLAIIGMLVMCLLLIGNWYGSWLC